MSKRIRVIACCLLVAFSLPTYGAEKYDVVIQNGRVIDPESGLDGVRNVGIRGATIARVSTDKLEGARVIEARGLVVAPGFIDLHQHQHDLESYQLKALDGVTTALELESGVPDFARFVEVRRDKTPINFGASASHIAARLKAWNLPLPSTALGAESAISAASGPATNDPASADQLKLILATIKAQLVGGALGIGIGLEYTPGATRQEVIALLRLASEHRHPVFVHLRSGGPIEPGSSIESVNEIAGAAAITGASVHIMHINSQCMREALECLSMIDGLRARGLDVTTEAYPYGEAMTFVSSAFFNPGWQEKRSITYNDLELPDTHKRLTRETFDALRVARDPQPVVIHLNPEEVVTTSIQYPGVIVASDGLRPHPRNAGTFSRVLARYVRNQKTLTLSEAIGKMSLLPARRLESATSAARRKGRLQEGVDADIAVFDPNTIQDNATFVEPVKASTGMRYVFVAGTLVVDNGKLTKNKPAGRAFVADEVAR